MLRLLPVLFALSLLSACGASTPSPTKVNLPELPAELKTCPKLQSVSARAGDATEVGDDQMKTWWAQDRTVAVKCARRLDGLVGFYEGLQADLASEPEK